MFFTALNTQKDSQSWVEKKRGRDEIKVTWWRKRRDQRGREQSTSQPKMGTEDLVCKGTKLKISTKKQRLKI